jgi:glycosyltransferase involved in cell wall biosynthesis
MLVLAYRFPPQGGGGVQRTLKFVKYLPQHGWLPVVHTVSNPFWPLRDESLLREVPPDVAVYRTPTVEFERLARAAADPGDTGAPGTAGAGVSGPRPSARQASLARRLAKGLHGAVMRNLLVPDPQIAWVPGAVARSWSLVRREGVQVLYTSSPPNSCQVAGLLLKRLTGLPWIADFRDPWTQGIRRKAAYARTPWRGRLEATLERAVLTRADHVLLTTDKTLEQYLAAYPELPREKFSVITNGFDAADFALPRAAETLLDSGRFQLTLTGNVEEMFDAMPFFTALRELRQSDEGIRAHLRVNFIGTKRGKYDAFIRENGLAETVRYVGYVPHQTCLRYLAESDALFLCQIPVHESASTKLSGKLFEYLYMRKPILALTIPGLTSEILERSRLGRSVDPADVAGIQQAVRDLYDAWYRGYGRPEADEAYIATFDRVLQAERLATLADRVLAGPAA